MSLVFFSLGSNIEPSKNLSDARIELSKYFSLKKFSSTYQSPSAGFDGADFLNEVLCFETDLEVSEVLKITKNIEKKIIPFLPYIHHFIIPRLKNLFKLV